MPPISRLINANERSGYFKVFNKSVLKVGIKPERNISRITKITEKTKLFFLNLFKFKRGFTKIILTRIYPALVRWGGVYADGSTTIAFVLSGQGLAPMKYYGDLTIMNASRFL